MAAKKAMVRPKISAVRSLAYICFLHVFIRLIKCIFLSVYVSVFLVLSILHTVIAELPRARSARAAEHHG